jgi:hypothetical protein
MKSPDRECERERVCVSEQDEHGEGESDREWAELVAVLLRAGRGWNV